MVVLSFNPSNLADREVDLGKFEASLFYTVSYRPAKVVTKTSCL